MPDRIPYYKAYEIPCEIACCVSVCECYYAMMYLLQYLMIMWLSVFVFLKMEWTIGSVRYYYIGILLNAAQVRYDKPYEITSVSNKIASEVLGIVSDQVSNNVLVGITLNPSIHVHMYTHMYVYMHMSLRIGGWDQFPHQMDGLMYAWTLDGWMVLDNYEIPIG